MKVRKPQCQVVTTGQDKCKVVYFSQVLVGPLLQNVGSMSVSKTFSCRHRNLWFVGAEQAKQFVGDFTIQVLRKVNASVEVILIDPLGKLKKTKKKIKLNHC